VFQHNGARQQEWAFSPGAQQIRLIKDSPGEGLEKHFNEFCVFNNWEKSLGLLFISTMQSSKPGLEPNKSNKIAYSKPSQSSFITATVGIIAAKR